MCSIPKACNVMQSKFNAEPYSCLINDLLVEVILKNINYFY